MNDELEPGVLVTDKIPVRMLKEADLTRIIAIDKKIVGRPREEYFRQKVKAALAGQTMQTSLVAEANGLVVGFVLANLYYGEFGRTEPVAVMDSIGVDPEFRHQHVGDAIRLAQLPDDSLNASYQVRSITHRITKRDGFATTIGFRSLES